MGEPCGEGLGGMQTLFKGFSGAALHSWALGRLNSLVALGTVFPASPWDLALGTIQPGLLEKTEAGRPVGNPLGAAEASWGFGAENFVTFPLPRLLLATLNGGHVSALSGCCAGGRFREGRDWWVSTPAGVLVGENWGSPRAQPRFRIGG